MEFHVRPTQPDDLEAIVRIESDPLVRAQQYPLGELNSVERWRWLLFEGGFGCVYTHSTIRIDDRIAGTIARTFEMMGERRFRASYGWNLAPEFWGRGIMPAALTQDFAMHFNDARLVEVRADCFHDNARCIRVLQKLGCRATFVNPFERVDTMFRRRCYRWIVRYRLTRKMWEAGRPIGSTASGLR